MGIIFCHAPKLGFPGEASFMAQAPLNDPLPTDVFQFEIISKLLALLNMNEIYSPNRCFLNTGN